MNWVSVPNLLGSPYREEKSITSGFGENLEFMDTSAHEIGHTILKAYGGTFYSYGHKGSVNTITQSESSNAKAYPKNGEMDMMSYYTDNPPLFDYNRFIAHEKDILSLLWLTKLELK
ncbi:hypothetical protein [Tenacibaculum maritimum]|nr:hypothetical protein [Tenacibaculum maritimum]